MGADANSQHLVKRHRSAISSKADEKILNEDEFDNEITTLNPAATNDVVNANLSHDKELEKLKEIGAKTPILPSEIGTDFNFKREVVWPNAIGFFVLHLCALIGVVITLLRMVDIRTTLYGKKKKLKRELTAENFIDAFCFSKFQLSF